MLLTITTTHRPATDLGYLLAKHPDRVQSFAVTGGTAYVWYPEASEQRCTAALLLDVDPVGLARPARRQASPDGFSLGRGGEGMVIKPYDGLAHRVNGKLAQPGIKCRGREVSADHLRPRLHAARAPGAPAGARPAPQAQPGAPGARPGARGAGRCGIRRAAVAHPRTGVRHPRPWSPNPPTPACSSRFMIEASPMS